MVFRRNSINIDYRAVFRGSNARLLVGRVKEHNVKDNSRKVACYKFAQDPVLLGFWSKRKYFRVMDQHCSSDIGDIVLISQLPRPHGHLITHKVEEVIYKNGALVDPISGRLVHGTNYAEEVANPRLQEYLEKQKGKETEL